MAKKIEQIPMTQEEYDELLKEQIELEERYTLVLKAIEDARSQGDLKENYDYQSARNDQKKLDERRKDIEHKIKYAVIITASTDSNFDKLVTVKFLNENLVETYHIVGNVGTDPINNVISHESPLGKAILKAKVGQQVTVVTEDNDRFDVVIVKIAKSKK